MVRALDAKSTLQAAVQGTNIDWTMLAAIGVRETGFVPSSEVDGAGVGEGIFQITVKNYNGSPNTDPANGVTVVRLWFGRIFIRDAAQTIAVTIGCADEFWMVAVHFDFPA